MEELKLLLSCLTKEEIEKIFFRVESVANLSKNENYDKILKALAIERSIRINAEQDNNQKVI